MIPGVDGRPPLDTERVRIGDAARILGVHPNTLRRGAPAWGFPRPIRIGSKRERRYAVADLRAYLEREG